MAASRQDKSRIDQVTDDVCVDAVDLQISRAGRPVLRPMTFQVRRGTVTGLIGPSGSGKTTLMRAVVGVQRLSSGRLLVLGEDQTSTAVKGRIGYVTQAPSIYSDLTVHENVAFFVSVLGGVQEVSSVLRTVDLLDHATTVVGNLSGGEKSRASLAVALLGNPELLVMDEPTVGLDPLLRRQLWRTFHRLRDEGTTLIVSSHVMDEAERCDDLLMLRDGALVYAGTPSDFKSETGMTSIEDAFLVAAHPIGDGS